MHISKLKTLKWTVGIGAFFVGAIFLYSLRAPVLPYAAEEIGFTVEKGEGLSVIAGHLKQERLIRSSWAFKALAVLRRSARTLKPGTYTMSARMSANEILTYLENGKNAEEIVRVLDGATIFETDRVLADAGVLKKGTLIAFAKKSTEPLEGKLFPDTYRLFRDADVATVVEKLTARFHEQADAILDADSRNRERNLILASLLEKEVPDIEERRVVAGILLKRVAEGMPLQVDASVCYAKEIAAQADVRCYPLTALDMQAPSPYNTYQHKGWPPGPIGSPGVSALTAAMDPVESPYWYYLSDPKTSRTIFSITLEEHTKNRVRYLKN